MAYAMRVMWRDDVASFDGKYVKFAQMECRPWPVKRSIPLFIGGSSDAAIRRAALKGDGYFPFIFPGENLTKAHSPTAAGPSWACYSAAASV